MHVQTPVDLERKLGLRQGEAMRVEMSLDQMLLWRPLPELAGYHVPGPDGVFGASGRRG